MPIARFPQPYRGQPRPKVHGYPSPPKPIHQTMEHIFWFVFALVGVGVFCYAILNLTERGELGGFFVLAIYLVFLAIAIFAYKDAKKIETITPDENEQKGDGENHGKNGEENEPSPLEEHFIEVEQAPARPKGRYASRLNPPQPNWRYLVSSKKLSNRTNRFFLGIFMGEVVILGVGAIFGFSSPITITLIVMGFLAFLTVYLMRD